MSDINVLNEFQSTLSMRRATADRVDLIHTIVISIHALHEESDGIVGIVAVVLL